MHQVTMDTNCLMYVKLGAPEASDVLAVQGAHRAGRIHLRVVAASATDITVNGERVTDFQQFKAWLASIGFADHEILKPILIYGIGFYGEFVWGMDRTVALYEDIWGVLAKGRESPDPGSRRYRSLMHDALMMWAHLHYGGDVFVTNDTDDFRRGGRGDRFVSMGAGAILTPAEAAAQL